MGPVASRTAGLEFCRRLFVDLERESRRSIAQTGEISVPALGVILDAGLDNLAHRDELVAYLSAYLSRCVTGSVPDHRHWEPPQ